MCPEFIYHEIWQDDQLIKIWQNTDQAIAGNERESSHQFFGLEPGNYQYVSRVINTEGKADTAGTNFTH